MIDTIVLTLDKTEFFILDHDAFSPSTQGLYTEPLYKLGNNHYLKCTQNPAKHDMTNGIYKPRLTVTKRMHRTGYSIALRIEFSIPKLLYGNNFDEVQDEDFSKVLIMLQKKLREMKVYVPLPILETASVSAIHFGKNIVLTDYSTPFGTLKDIAKIDVNKQLDLNQTDFRNAGHSVKYRANSFEVTFYDKVKDLEKGRVSEKRALEKEYYVQKELFKRISLKKPFEVLRMEVRLNNRRKIQHILNKCDLKTELSFQGLFKKSISQNILLWYINEIITQSLLVSQELENPLDFIIQFKLHNPSVKTRKALQILGIFTCCQNAGIRSFREVIEVFGKDTWSKLKQELKKYNCLSKTPDNLQKLKETITEFHTLKLNNFIQDKN
ncbi:MAG: hypothetical protein AB1454_12590 [Candidatus Auribacterota bacterium]